MAVLPMWRRRPVSLLLVLGVAVLAVGCVPSNSTATFQAQGAPIPLPSGGMLPDITGDQFEGMLVSQRGRVVIVNVWASWCVPCRTEAPLLQRASESYPDVTFLGVDSKDGRRAAAQFIDEFDIRYPNVIDSSGEIRQRLGLRGFPTTYIFGPDGALRAGVVGGISEQRLAAQIEDARRS